MSTRRAIPAGVLDAGLASLATFVVGIFAAHSFEPAVLGWYALAFSAFQLASMVSRELVYVPAEVAAVTYPRRLRLHLLPNTLRLGLAPAAVAALLVSLWSIAAPKQMTGEVGLALTITAIASTFLSPVQDHLRRMLHIGGRSWTAVGVSVVQVVGVSGVLGGMLYLGVPGVWIPFGALAVANFLSLLAGGVMLHARRIPRPAVETPLTFAELTRTGWLLLFGALLAPGSGFVASVLVTHLAGAEALGYAEAARVLARPLPVLAMGLAAVFRPLSIEAAQKRQLSKARRASRLYLGVFGACGLLYMAVAGADVGWNPIAALLPSAYVVTGLAAAAIMGEILSVIQLPYRYEMLGGGRVKSLVRVEMIGAALRSLTAATAGFTYSFAMPMGNATIAVVRAIGYRRALRDVYRTPEREQPLEKNGENLPAAVGPEVDPARTPVRG